MKQSRPLHESIATEYKGEQNGQDEWPGRGEGGRFLPRHGSSIMPWDQEHGDEEGLEHRLGKAGVEEHGFWGTSQRTATAGLARTCSEHAPGSLPLLPCIAVASYSSRPPGSG
jgi:hypothetical protein